jgi:hypothetical protein
MPNAKLKRTANTPSVLDLSQGVRDTRDVIDDSISQIKDNKPLNVTNKELTDTIEGPNAELVGQALVSKNVLQGLLEEMKHDKSIGPDTEAGGMVRYNPQIKAMLDAIEGQNLPLLDKQIEALKSSAGIGKMIQVTPETAASIDNLLSELRHLRSVIDARQRPKLPVQMGKPAFNLRRYKIAQALPMGMPPAMPPAAPVAPPMPPAPLTPPPQPMDIEGQLRQMGFIPLGSWQDFAGKLLKIITAKNNRLFKLVADAIIEEGAGNQQVESKDPLVQLKEYMSPKQNPNNVDESLVNKAALWIYNQLPESWKSPTENTMAQNEQPPKGIHKFNLSQYVLNNKESACPGMSKEASTQGLSDSYLLYGPGEKRICPKLRGRGGGKIGANDVVSEYICRHHCLDGIVIDDSRTICGEALWRANVMDKFSRPYKDEDGNWKGGYIEGRFEINRAKVDEENRMQLKPGERRLPRPASQGNLESRMQDMRNKEGKKRDYRPTTDTSKPFNWTKDVDQNNVEVAQSERDRREEAAGHQTVEYTNRDKGENNPKVTQGFNLKRYKTAQIIPADGYADGGEPYDDEEMELMNVKCPTCQGEGKFMGMLGDLLHFRCLQCGMEFNKPTEFGGKSMPVQTDLEDQTGRSPIVSESETTTKVAGPTSDQRNYPFAEKVKQYRRYQDAQLEYAVKDADQAFVALGRENPDQGWYADDVHTILEEIRRREAGRKWTGTPLAELMGGLKVYNTRMSFVDQEGAETEVDLPPNEPGRIGFNLKRHKEAELFPAQVLEMTDSKKAKDRPKPGESFSAYVNSQHDDKDPDCCCNECSDCKKKTV